MLKHNPKLPLIAAALVAAGIAHASDFVTADGTTVRTAFGECVRTGYWTVASLDCEAPSVAPVKVFFAFDQAELGVDGRKALDALADRFRDGAVDRVVAVGYADALGPEKYNQRLSELRARAVRDYLLEKGLPLHAFRLEGKGKRDAQTTGACERGGAPKDATELIACLGPDRRVEITLRR